MNSPDMQQRLIELESIVTHLQHDLETFNEVILKQQAAMAELKQTVAKLEKQLGEIPESGAVFDASEERPPHY